MLYHILYYFSENEKSRLLFEVQQISYVYEFVSVRDRNLLNEAPILSWAKVFGCGIGSLHLSRDGKYTHGVSVLQVTFFKDEQQSHDPA